MVQYKHNEPYYTLQLSELADGAVRVLAFEGAEQISHLFHYRLELLSEDAELDPAAILNKKATLFFNRGEEDPLPVHGIISHFEQRGRTPDYVSYYAELVPRMWRLQLNLQSRVFQNMNIEQMITEVLESAEFAGEDFEFKLNETYPEIEFAVQYRETDFNFINRRLEHYGIFYYFEHKEDNDVIVFTDVNDNFPAIETEEEIAYNPNKDPLSERETVSRFIYQGQVVTGKTQLKDYNYRTPSKELIAESQINSDNPGIHSDYGDHFADESEGDFQARIRDEEMVSRGTLYTGNSDCRPFHAGYLFTMNDHYRTDWNQEFLLKKVVSRGNQGSLFGTFPSGSKVPPTYENIFESIPVSIPFRPRREAMQPRISGVLNAKIDAAGDGSQAEVDDQGRYKVILPFDLSGKTDGEASCFIRMIQPYAGPNYGMHFPLHKDTEVLLTFIDGDPDQPVISGAVPNPETVSPITSANPTKSVIRDNYGNEIVMDATPGDEHIRLYSPNQQSSVEIGRCIKSYCDDDQFDGFFGNKFEYGVGTKYEAYAGAVAEGKLGLTGDLTIGGKYEVDIGGKYTYGLAYNVNNCVGPDIKSTEKDMLSTAKQDSVIVSGDQFCMVAAAQKGNDASKPIIYAGEKKLSLSIGKQDNTAQYFKSSSGWMGYISLFTSMLTAAMTSVTLHFAANKNAKDIAKDWKFWTPLSIGGASFISTIGLAIATIIIRIRDGRIEPIEHYDQANKTTATAMITLSDEQGKEGIFLEKTKVQGAGLTPAAHIKITSEGGVYANSRDDKIVLGVGDPDQREKAQVSVEKDQIEIVHGQGQQKGNRMNIVYIGKDGTQIRTDKEIIINSKAEIKMSSYKKITMGRFYEDHTGLHHKNLKAFY